MLTKLQKVMDKVIADLKKAGYENACYSENPFGKKKGIYYGKYESGGFTYRVEISKYLLFALPVYILAQRVKGYIINGSPENACGISIFVTGVVKDK